MQEGTPLELIQQEGKFQELCKAAGAEEYLLLSKLARHAGTEESLVDV